VPGTSNSLTVDPQRHEDLLRQAQRLRGAIYLRDGAINSSHLTGGLHQVRADRNSWHLLVLDHSGDVSGCVRYRQYSPEVDIGSLASTEASLARCPTWGAKLQSAVLDELNLAKTLHIPFIEIGGWAVSEEIRCTMEALRMVLAIYAFSRELGGAVGLATATTRHGSASILRRIGGRSLTYQNEPVPAYQDPQYSCAMEVLRFYSWAPNPRYDVWIGEIGREIQGLPIVCAEYPDFLGQHPEVARAELPSRELLQ